MSRRRGFQLSGLAGFAVTVMLGVPSSTLAATAYVTNSNSGGSVTPINTTTGEPGPEIKVLDASASRSPPTAKPPTSSDSGQKAGQ